MSEERALTWSRKWHIVNPDHPDAGRYAVGRCGTYLYRNDDPRYPNHLKAIRDGLKQSTGLCKRCSQASGVKSISVELVEPTSRQNATEDEHGYFEWDYPHGSVAVTDDGTIMWGQWHITDPEKVFAAGAALISAAEQAKRSDR